MFQVTCSTGLFGCPSKKLGLLPIFAPTVPAGVTAVTLVDETTTTLVAATPPTVTLVAPVKFAPVIVIGAPPKELL